VTDAPTHAAFVPGVAGPAGGVRRFSHAAMATVFEVHSAHGDAGYARQAAHAAFQLVDRLEREQSRFVANSDLSRINELAAGQVARVSPSTMECLELARRLFDRTGGAFDVSIGSGLDSLELAPDELTVRARADGVRLDLGGIGKGYAVDRMAELLDEWEVRRALVHGGFSSVLALEAPRDRDGWPLTLSAPRPGEQKVLARVSARHRALSASGTQKGGHILDPRTGRPVHGRAAWVALPRAQQRDPIAPGGLDVRRWPATVAEGLSTAFVILSGPQIEETCRQWPGLEAWLLGEPTGEGGPGSALVHVAGPATAEG
jgi:thiamine biosynthesis lipoprotein